MISSVNLSEVLANASEAPKGFDAAKAALRSLQLAVIPFDEQQEEIAAGLRPVTRTLGLSLGDRCCLALGIVEALPVMTTDRGWSELQLGIKIHVIR